MAIILQHIKVSNQYNILSLILCQIYCNKKIKRPWNDLQILVIWSPAVFRILSFTDFSFIHLVPATMTSSLLFLKFWEYSHSMDYALAVPSGWNLLRYLHGFPSFHSGFLSVRLSLTTPCKTAASFTHLSPSGSLTLLTLTHSIYHLIYTYRAKVGLQL